MPNALRNKPILCYLEEWSVLIADRHRDRFTCWRLNSLGMPIFPGTTYSMPQSIWTLGGGMTKHAVALVETVSSSHSGAALMREICRCEFVDTDTDQPQDPHALIHSGTFSGHVGQWANEVLRHVCPELSSNRMLTYAQLQ